MSRILTLLFFCLLATGLYAQAPNGFKFQAVARDASNVALSSQNVAVRISLVRGSASGIVDYSERHEVSTTDLGVFDLHIGNGVNLTGDFNDVNWGDDAYYIKVDMDAAGGTDYINMGASQLLSVPYALYAKSSGSGGGSNPTDELQNLIYDPVTNTLTLTNGNSVTLNGGGGGIPQTLMFDPLTNMLTISEGNTIELPAGPQGETGPAGPQGEQGPQGVTGPAGADGAMGLQGPQGEAGPTGPQGEQGPQGATGSAGPAGADGAMGLQGPQGEAGPAGPQGEQGLQGEAGTGINLLGAVATVGDLPAGANQGDLYIVNADGDGYAWDGSMWNNVGQIQGPAGAQGETGPTGPTGSTGAMGPAGETGPAGPAGTAGPQGEQGPQGAVGPEGPQGPAGQDGTGISLLGTVANVGDLPGGANNGDLYIVSASGDGYAWDGSMWVNVGPIQGPQGEAGASGPQGEQGPVGPAGTMGMQGPQGEAGPTGAMGPAGAQGEQGPQGETGAAGPQGVPGPQGAVGPAGADGAMGLPGPQGEVGPAGAQGPQGDVGPAGVPGAMGLQGPQGNAGPAGPQGLQGEAGPAGPQGEQGPAGPAGTYVEGAGISIAGDVISATDNSPTNEIQTISLNGDNLELSNGGGSVNVSALGSSVWTEDLTGAYYNDEVGIGANPETGSSKLYINSADNANVIGLHIDANNVNTAAAEIHNDAGLALSTLGGIKVESESSNQAKITVVNTSVDGSSTLQAENEDGRLQMGPVGSIGPIALGDIDATITGGANINWDGSAPLAISTSDQQPIHIGTDFTARMTIGANGGVGIGETSPTEALVVADEDRSQVAIDGTESDGKASLAFRQFEGIDSYRGYMFESDQDDLAFHKFGLYNYNYLIGNPDNVNRTPLYEVKYENGALSSEPYKHVMNGTFESDGYTKINAFDNQFGSNIDMEVDSNDLTGVSRNFNLSVTPGGGDSTIFQLAGNDYVPSFPFTIVNPVPAFTSTYHQPTGGMFNRFYGQTKIDNLLLGHKLTLNFDRTAFTSSLELLSNNGTGAHGTTHATYRDNTGRIVHTLDEQYIGDGGSGAYSNPLYRVTTNPDEFNLPGGSHWFYGDIQTDGLKIGYDFSAPIFSGGMLEILAPANDGIPAIHIDADNNNTAAFQVHNADGPSIEALGGIDVASNSTINRPHLRLEEIGNDFARIELTNDQNSAFWHIAGVGNDGTAGAASSRLNFYFSNNQGAADRFTIRGNGHVGIKNTNPDEELVIGSNLGAGWAIPAITVGETTGGGAVQVGNTTTNFSMSSSATFNRTRLIASDADGFGQGTIEVRADNVAIGTAPGTTTATLEVEHDNFGLFIQHEDNTANHWEIYSSASTLSPDLILYTDNGSRGRFDEVSGNYSATSDVRLKTNISTFSSALPGILQLQAKRYNYKANSQRIYNGFLAQELREVFPEVVTETAEKEGEETTLMVDYNQLTVLAIGAVKEQNETIQAQAKKIESLEARLARLEALIGKED